MILNLDKMNLQNFFKGNTMAVISTNIQEYPLISRGKVRDIYEIDSETLLIITTDRMSAFDIILDDPIEGKGQILNQITLFWFDMFKDIIPNHVITADLAQYPENLHKYKEELEGRSVLVKKAKPLPVECIIRGYITGSGWKDYKNSGMVCGYKLPENLLESAKLEQPLFTPSTKAEVGEHDENITVEQAEALLGKELATKVAEVSMAMYKAGRDYADTKGIIIADTKFEFGLIGDELILIDEALTPDSSRFWPKDLYEIGKGQPSFDKQYLRDWLETQDWDKTAPAPRLPEVVAKTTAEKYRDVYIKLTK